MPDGAVNHTAGTVNGRARPGSFTRSTSTPAHTSAKANSVPMFVGSPSRRGADGAEDARADHGANRQHDEIAGAEDALERPRLVGDDEIGDGFAGKELRILNPWA